MNASTGHAYTQMADAYVALIERSGDRSPELLSRLDEFVDRVGDSPRPVADLGCGPGHIGAELAGRGVTVVGFDLSTGMLRHACAAFPMLALSVCDNTALGVATESFGGAVARHSIIHLRPDGLGQAFAEWHRMLIAGAPLFVSFFAAATSERHGQPFDHKVITAYELFPATIAAELAEAGFVDIDVVMRSPRPGERMLDHALVLATRSGE